MLVVARELREMLGDREVLVHGRGLEHDADPPSPVEIRGRWIGAEHLHLTRIALSVALQDLDRRRLAGAVRTEQTEDLAGAELEVDALQRFELAIRLGQAANADDRGHGGRI